MITIIEQPKNSGTRKKIIGQISWFSIKAEGDVDGYQWCLTEEKKGEMNIIKNATANTLAIKITKENANREVCCLVLGTINNEPSNVRSNFVPLSKK